MKPLKTLALVTMVAAFGFTVGTAYGDDGIRVRGAVRLDLGCGTVEYRTPDYNRVVVVERPVIIYKKHHRHNTYRDRGWGRWFERNHRGRTVIVLNDDERHNDNGRRGNNGRNDQDNGKNRVGRDDRNERRR